MPTWAIALLTVIGILLVLLIGMVVYFFVQMGKMQVLPEDTGKVQELIKGDSEYASAKPSVAPIMTPQPSGEQQTEYNILLYGIDSRDANSFENGLSDTIMLVNMNTEKGTIKLVSFMRDTLVTIPGHSKNRLNTCYKFGGHALTNEVLSSHYGVDVDWYAVVNFWSFADLVDVIGGVQVDVKQEELSAMQDNLQEIYNLDKSEPLEKAPKKGGVSLLNGKQAVAYARIRHTGNGDFERTSRQRVVMEAIIKELKQSNLVEITKMIDVGTKYVRTNVSKADMLKVASAFFQLKDADIQQFRLPDDGAYKLTSYNGASVISVDFEENAQRLKDFLNN